MYHISQLASATETTIHGNDQSVSRRMLLVFDSNLLTGHFANQNLELIIIIFLLLCFPVTERGEALVSTSLAKFYNYL